jgi:sulfatase maturation enzyme AslB (radical SAM superfamily)
MSRDGGAMPPASEVVSVEQGYLVLTLMPSLFCKHRCPHCYLSLEQRKNPARMDVETLRAACRKIDGYYRSRGIARKTVVNYWYGGEPTQMGTEYFAAAAEAIDGVFAAEEGYDSRHSVLSSLVGVDLGEWKPLLDRFCRGEVQTSYDGPMRGDGYVGAWERKVSEARAMGLRVSTISVVNRSLLDMGPSVLDRLAALGVAETSWLPFMRNEQNAATGKYDELAPSMDEWSSFMIALTERWMEMRRAGLDAPHIGQMHWVRRQRGLHAMANVAGQTLFLMPDGEISLPDYRDGWTEFMRPFGNIVEQELSDILASPARRAYLRRQVMRNGNGDCMSCEHAGHCVMEFWKPNRPGDDCFGGRRYVEWVVSKEDEIAALAGREEALLY